MLVFVFHQFINTHQTIRLTYLMYTPGPRLGRPMVALYGVTLQSRHAIQAMNEALHTFRRPIVKY